VGTLYELGIDERILLVKLDPTGAIVWRRTYGGSGAEYGYSVDLTPDGGFVIGGLTTSHGNGQQTYVLKVDSTGEQEWDSWYGGVEQDCIGNVTTAQNGDIVVSGCRTMYMIGNNSYFRSHVARFTSAGELLWERLYGPTDIFNGRYGNKELSDGSFISPGSSLGGTNNRPKGVLLKFAANGDSLWMRYYQQETSVTGLDYHDLRDVVVEPDGGFTACGVAFDIGYQDLWVIRVDSMGCLVPGCELFEHVAEQGIALNILVHPNPTNGRLYLSFRSATEPEGVFTLHNTVGQEVQRFAPRGPRVEINMDISQQPAGIYLLRYVDPAGLRWESKVIKE